MKRKRGLGEDERALWHRVTRTVAPLRPVAPPPSPAAQPHEETPSSSPAARNGEPAPPRAAVKPGASARPARAAAPGDIDRKTRRRLGRGTQTIDARIDLHGMTQTEAHRALLRFIETSLVHHRRMLLVITGKGRGGEGTGVLRRSVPQWLESAELRRVVVSYGPASPAHGGDGALYVQIGRSKKRKLGVYN